MIAEIIWTKPALRVLKVMIEGGDFTYYSANELSEKTGLSTPTVLETLNNLLAVGVIERVKATKKRYYFKLRYPNPIYPPVAEFLEIMNELEGRIADSPLTHIDEIVGEEYYVGMYWAAMSNIIPVDYAPRIYAVYTKKPQWVLPLRNSDQIYVELEEKWKPPSNRDTYIAVIHVKSFPHDLTISDVNGEKARTTSVERGIAQTFKSKIYPPYAATLALLQNKDYNRIDEDKLEKVAIEEGVIHILKAVAYTTNKLLGKRIFSKLAQGVKEVESKGKIAWENKPNISFEVLGRRVSIDDGPIREAITTVYG